MTACKGTGNSLGQEANKENIEHSSDRRELFGEEKQNKIRDGWRFVPNLDLPDTLQVHLI